MESNYALYIKEREGKSIVEDECGFATYYYPEDNIVYVEDVFVKKEYRRTGKALEYFDKITKEARDKGCEFCITSIDPKAKGALASLKWTLKNGYNFSKQKDGLNWYCKEIQ